jgi:hypothetical protein
VQIFNSLLKARDGLLVASVPAFAHTLAAPVRKPRLWQEATTADRQLCQVHPPRQSRPLGTWPLRGRYEPGYL